MRIEVLGNLDNSYFQEIAASLNKLIKAPKLHAYVVNNIEQCKVIGKTLPQNAKKSFIYLCEREIHLSYSYKNHNLVVIFITENNKYLLKHKDALIGLFLHEMIHIHHRKKGIYRKINKAYNEYYLNNYLLLKELPYPYKHIEALFNEIGNSALLLLKDLYSNTELIKRGYSKYLVEQYYQEFKAKKTCPKPVFYDKFKEAVKKDLGILGITFEFEFALLSVVLPFEKLDREKSRKLIRHIKRCYTLNIKEIERKCAEFSTLYLECFDDQSFDNKFFTNIFFKIYNILK